MRVVNIDVHGTTARNADSAACSLEKVLEVR